MAVRGGLSRDDRALWDGAVRVLLTNWEGTYTVPSRSLYPHQWSWDSALIAVGLAQVSATRAQLELESLLGAQWADGRVPQIVFNAAAPREAYFPGPDFWGSREAPGSPTVETSGIVQPPVHARAAWEVYLAEPETARARGFLERAYPRLVAQHDYLRRCRDVGGHALVSIVHPWESGLDNSPAWDAALAAVVAGPEVLAPYRRRDLDHADAAERPTDRDYARYVCLAQSYRDGGYEDAGLAERHPFLMEDPLFNALLAWSDEALAEIAVVLGLDPAEHRADAARTSRAILDRQYDAAAGHFFATDPRSGDRAEEYTVAGLAPLVLPHLPDDVVDALTAAITGPRFALSEQGPLPSYDLTSASYDASRYWRGPAWINTSWLVWRGLARHGRAREAETLRRAMLAAVRRAGFREYFDARSGAGRGSEDFSWTAALTLDALAHPPG